jgi:large subunit ribosomal protein L9
MKVILLKSIPKVGKKDEVIDIAAGYAQHALFPKKLAIAATPIALKSLERQKQNTAAEKEVRHALLNKAIEALNNDKLVMQVKANEQGSLFSKIHAADIAAFLMEMHRIAIDAASISLPDGPIKKIGKYRIIVSDEDYHSTFTIELVQQ